MRKSRNLSRAVLALCILLVGRSHGALAQGTGTVDGDVAKIAAGYSLRVLQRPPTAGTFAPRAVLDTPAGLYILDFGGWVKGKGKLWRTSRSAGASRAVVYQGLDRPHGMSFGPDGLVYVGESTRIFRFDPVHPDTSREVVVTLPAKAGTWKHPLTQFAFLGDKSMLVNNGSKTDNCAKEKKPVCAEAEGSKAAATVLRIPFVGAKAQAQELYVRGLRNSMALLVHASGTVLQAENSRDAINEADPKLSDVELPHDEINVLTKGAAYGWPYCFDAQRNAPEFRAYDCKGKTVSPTILLPAHSAPLGMAYWNGQLVVSLHGYRDTGHRLVTFTIDDNGIPSGNPTDLVLWKGDDAADAPPGPVGLNVTKDGALLIADDRRGMILELKPS